MQLRLMRRVLRNLPHKNISINLTCKQFADEDTMQQLSTFATHAGNIGTLTVELTEAPTLDELITLGQQYRQAGINIALDDIGLI